MHESGIVGDLMRKVEAESGGSPRQVASIRIRVGVLSGLREEALRQGMRRYATERWGISPRITVDHGRHPSDPDALGVTLLSIGLEG
ncbi:MAG: hypothetical protein ACLFWM_07415 [Actinomycetota bacterium]